MTDQHNSLVKELFFEGQPLHVFEYEGKIAFIAQEVADILGIKDAAASCRDSKALEKSIDYEIISAKFLGANEKNSFALGGSRGNIDKITILFLSGFFLFVLRSNKPIAVPLSRWAIREAIPQAFEKKNLEELPYDIKVKLVKEERQGSGIARHILSLHGWIDPYADKQLTFGDTKPDGPTGKEQLTGTDREGGHHD